jgi:hypothetical protein
VVAGDSDAEIWEEFSVLSEVLGDVAWLKGILYFFVCSTVSLKQRYFLNKIESK